MIDHILSFHQQDTAETTVDCIVVGGGPAGMMTGLLLARHGVRVTVLEKHADFLRDFRGDTIHPSTMRVMDQLGIIDRFLTIPHRRMSTVAVSTPDGETVFADFSRLPEPYNYVAFMPQWDFLDFLAQEAQAFPSLELLRDAQVTDLLFDGNRVDGVRYKTPVGEKTLSARLVIGADGRHSTVRAHTGLARTESNAPMDVLWFRVSRQPDDKVPFVSTGQGFTIVAVDRGSYWQIAYCIPKGDYAELHSQDIDVVAERLNDALPVIGVRFRCEIASWDDLNLLTVSVNRLKRWHRPGLLCLGDAAHAMSPAGGVGINLAIQDAIATSRILGPVLARGETPADKLLGRVQRRRQWPARIVQAGQVRILADLYPKSIDAEYKTPRAAKVIRKSVFLQKTVARIIGIGLRPESL
ncbi:FAD-dependent oxidoreductase [Brevibacterium sp. FME37]|uniref:FAD-dependent oxidoreductase n=1 Tax=Brevibacterium sp. FME37 TaxID=2742607 RepID=UPI001866E2F8|nr:FAD-dependent oxidoreductase [Brevibacterium sp. FME37]